MEELFRIVVRWIAVFLIGIAAGNVATAAGHVQVTALLGALGVIVGALFVSASVQAGQRFYVSRLGRVITEEDRAQMNSLAGPGLHRATVLGFGAAGVTAGALAPALLVGAVAAAAAVVVLVTGRWSGSDKGPPRG